MPQRPVPPDPGRDGDPAGEPDGPDDARGGGRIPASAPASDAATEEDWLAWCEAVAAEDEPPEDEDEEPDSGAPWDYDLDAIIAEFRQVTAEEAALVARAARLGQPRGLAVGLLGRRGPGQPGSARPSGGYGSWRLSSGASGQPDLIVGLDPISTGDCDHRFAARGHDPGVKLRHLSQIRHARCTGPGCRRPASQCDFEHNTPYEAGGRTCMCNGGPKCRFDHRLKQDRRWKVDQLPDGTFRWTAPSGRRFVTEATRYPA